jgi:hypothetical protein
MYNAPVALTTPEKSRPGIKGSFVCLYSPRRTFQSAALTLVATMSMTTSPGPTIGSGKSPYWKEAAPASSHAPLRLNRPQQDGECVGFVVSALPS